MNQKVAVTAEALSGVTARQRAMLKLQYGGLPLSEEELAWVDQDRRSEAATVRRRSLEEVAVLFGITRERVRQINGRSLRKLGLTEGAWRVDDSR